MSDAENAVCHKCGRAILWASTSRGRRPFDAVPVVVAIPRHGSDLAATPVYARGVDLRQAYSLHWKTCPKADEHIGRAGYLAGKDD